MLPKLDKSRHRGISMIVTQIEENYSKKTEMVKRVAFGELME